MLGYEYAIVLLVAEIAYDSRIVARVRRLAEFAFQS